MLNRPGFWFRRRQPWRRSRPGGAAAAAAAAASGPRASPPRPRRSQAPAAPSAAHSPRPPLLLQALLPHLSAPCRPRPRRAPSLRPRFQTLPHPPRGVPSRPGDLGSDGLGMGGGPGGGCPSRVQPLQLWLWLPSSCAAIRSLLLFLRPPSSFLSPSLPPSLPVEHSKHPGEPCRDSQAFWPVSKAMELTTQNRKRNYCC